MSWAARFELRNCGSTSRAVCGWCRWWAALSPRYMRLWYRDRLQKGVLATFAGTFTFAFGLLRRIEDDFVPDIGVTLAGVAVAASLGLLLIYLDRFTHRLHPVAVAALVRQAGLDVLEDWTGRSAPATNATRPPLLRAAVRCGTFRRAEDPRRCTRCGAATRRPGW
jgi:uncharacterized membrane protein